MGGRAEHNLNPNQSRTPAHPIPYSCPTPNPKFQEWVIATYQCLPSGLRSSAYSRPSGLRRCPRRCSASSIFRIIDLLFVKLPAHSTCRQLQPFRHRTSGFDVLAFGRPGFDLSPDTVSFPWVRHGTSRSYTFSPR